MRPFLRQRPAKRGTKADFERSHSGFTGDVTHVLHLHAHFALRTVKPPFCCLRGSLLFLGGVVSMRSFSIIKLFSHGAFWHFIFIYEPSDLFFINTPLTWVQTFCKWTPSWIFDLKVLLGTVCPVAWEDGRARVVPPDTWGCIRPARHLSCSHVMRELRRCGRILTSCNTNTK